MNLLIRTLIFSFALQYFHPYSNISIRTPIFSFALQSLIAVEPEMAEESEVYDCPDVSEFLSSVTGAIDDCLIFVQKLKSLRQHVYTSFNDDDSNNNSSNTSNNNSSSKVDRKSTLRTCFGEEMPSLSSGESDLQLSQCMTMSAASLSVIQLHKLVPKLQSLIKYLEACGPRQYTLAAG